MKLSAYADDVCVVISDSEDVIAQRSAVTSYEDAAGAKVNWRKCTVLRIWPRTTMQPVPLPGGVQWRDDGTLYLGVHLGDAPTVRKNWEELSVKLEAKLKPWEHLLAQLSFRGRMLVANNMAAAVLWHRMKAPSPPEWLVTKANRGLTSFVWAGKHWLRPGVLHLPRHEGGQGLVDLDARVMCFRLQTAKAILYDQEEAPWRSLALALLRRAGGQMNLGLVDCSGLPAYYRNLGKAWQSLEWARRNPYCGMAAFLTEPLFFNDLFGETRREKRWPSVLSKPA